jgi:AcrR family transcriptional regulator
MTEAALLPPRDRLLMSGAHLMAERGFEGVSVREICTDAGTSNNMVHHYFGSKQGLLDAIVDEFSSEVFAIPMRLLDKEPKSKEEFLSILELLFETTLEAYIEHRSVMMVVVREQADPEALPEYMGSVAAFLEQAKAKGFVRKGVDTDMITGFFLDRILNQVQFAPWIKRNYGTDLLSDPEYRRQWCESNLDVLLNGIVT